MDEWKPTGHRRFRIERGRWGSGDRLVLQIEVRGIETWWSGGVIDSDWVNRWRDARVEDLTAGAPETQAETST